MRPELRSPERRRAAASSASSPGVQGGIHHPISLKMRSTMVGPPQSEHIPATPDRATLLAFGDRPGCCGGGVERQRIRLAALTALSAINLRLGKEALRPRAEQDVLLRSG